MKLYNEKRSELEEQQLHLNVGLAKIRDTFNQVEELQKSLGAKRAQLREKDEMGMLLCYYMMSTQVAIESLYDVNTMAHGYNLFRAGRLEH